MAVGEVYLKWEVGFTNKVRRDWKFVVIQVSDRNNTNFSAPLLRLARLRYLQVCEKSHDKNTCKNFGFIFYHCKKFNSRNCLK